MTAVSSAGPARPWAGQRLAGPWALGPVVVALLAALIGPEPATVGAARLAALVVATAGASLLVVRVGAADLATAAAVAAGAYLGGVGTALLEWPVLVGVPIGAVGGAAVGAVSGVLHARVGRVLGALTSLALGGGVVAAIGAWPAGGGVAGFHAVPLVAPGGPRLELAVIGVATLVALVVTGVVARSRTAAAAAVAVRAPVVAASLGRRPSRDGAVVGAAAGALAGAGGTLLAAVDGSVVPAGYGIQLAAALALAALVGGHAPLGPVLGALLVWGPGTVWPLVPLVGTAPPLLVMGPAGLVVLALRRGRPLLAPARPRPPGVGRTPAPRPPARPLALQVRGAATPTGPVDLDVGPGEVVALAGPNGAGKSTLLARVAGQLPDGGTVSLGARRAPRGAVRRARLGVHRTWQRPPDVDGHDVLRLLATEPAATAAASWAAQVVGLDLASGEVADGPSRLQLVQLAATGPGLALLDEPTDVAPERLSELLRGLAAAGTAVLVVDHRPEVLAAADRTVRLSTGEVTA